MKFLPLGKLKLEHLQKLLQTYTSLDERVVIGSKVGEDAAVIDFGDTYLVAKTDPITFVADDIGWYTIVVNANDIATRGAIPKWFLATVLLPENRTTEETVETIFAQLSEACRRFQITFCGGHTEITYGIDRPIVVGQMLGEVEKEKLVTTAGAQVGDNIILTKGIAIEATSIIARVKNEELRTKYSEGFLQTCKQFIHAPGISVVEDALLAVNFGQVNAMHDPTEGGLAMGLHELAEAANVGLHIDYHSIPIFPETVQLCGDYGLDPLGVIASGALLLTVHPNDTQRILAGLKSKGIQASIIGRIIADQEGRQLHKKEGWETLPIYEQDEMTKIFD
jgi:hydrogenase maturation factor